MTTQEYLHGLTQDRFLRQELNLASVVSSSLGAEAASCVQGIVLNSVISEAVTVPPDTIVEYSHVQSKVQSHHLSPTHLNRKFYNHREGPYYGLLLVESAYQLSHLRHYAKQMLTPQSRREIGKRHYANQPVPYDLSIGFPISRLLTVG